MDLLKTLLLYMAMVYASSVQAMPDVEKVMAAVSTPTPTVTATVTPSPTPAYSPVPTIDISPNPDYKTITMGDKGDDVRKLQEKLTEYGYYTGKLDGRFGRQTLEAVVLFQTNHGLSADGIPGKNTLTVLYDSNQVRPAVPVASPTPAPNGLSTAMTPEGSTATPEGKPTLAPTFAPLPANTAAANAAPLATETAAAQTLASGANTSTEPASTQPPASGVNATTQPPEFLAMADWRIQIAGQDSPMALKGEDGAEDVTITPYSYGSAVYVPLISILQAQGLVVVPSDNLSLTEYAFALGNDLYRITYTQTQELQPTDAKAYKNGQLQLLANQDIRLGGNFIYLTAETVTGLTGLTFDINQDTKVVTVTFPVEADG